MNFYDFEISQYISWTSTSTQSLISLPVGKINLTDSLSAVYFLGEDVPSKFLEILISCDQFKSEIEKIVRKMYLGKDALLSFRNLSIVIRHSSTSLALESYQLLAEVLSGQDGVKSIDVIAISEHTTLECHWLSETSYTANVDRLNKSHQSFRGKKTKESLSSTCTTTIIGLSINQFHIKFN